MVFDHAGNEVARHQLEHQQILPRPGWVEHDPVEIWERTRTVIEATLNASGLSARDLAAVGITNQRETTVVWNRRSGVPYANAIVWQDTRTDRIASALDKSGRGEVIRRKAGLPPATYFSGGKLQWLLENDAGLRADAARGDALFGTVDSWLLWHLTGGSAGGVHLTDVTNASRTMLMDLRTLDWDEELCGVFGVPRAMLPRIVPSAHSYGVTSLLGPFGGEVPVGGVLGDQQAATMGQVCFAPGEAKNTYGTGNFLVLNTGTKPYESKSGLLTTLAYQLGPAAAVTAWRAPSPSPVRPCSGCATSWASSAARRRARTWPGRSTTPPGCTSCRPSPGCSRRTGALTRGARSSGCPGSTPTRTWPAPRSRRSATRAGTWWRR
jgi:glycerol kinase